MKLTIDSKGYCLIARDEEGNVVAKRRTTCNPAALAQIILDAQQFGVIDWKNSQVAEPTKRKHTK